MNTKIKIITLSAVLLLAGLFSYGQKCKYDIDKKDHFSGEITRGNTVKINNALYFGFNKVGKNYNIAILLTVPAEDIARRGDSILLKAVSENNPDGSTITLYSTEDYTPATVAQAYSTGFSGSASTSARFYGQYRIPYPITEEQLQILNSGSIIFVRIHIANKFFDVEITPKQGKALKNAIHCIIQ